MYNGNGTMLFKDGASYVGGYRKNQRHGYGHMVCSCTSVYKGYFENDKFSGFGNFKFPVDEAGNRLSYIGGYKENVPSGNGTMIWNDGTTYVGQFKFGLKFGSGIETYPNGTKITGNWVRDQVNGFGIIRYSEDSDILAYEGYFKDGLFNGNGTLIWRKGTIYNGGFKNEKFEGLGIITFPQDDIHNRVTFEGTFENGIEKINGTLTMKNGDIYRGQIIDKNPNGYGLLNYSEENDDQRLSYEGFVENGKIHGNGTIMWRNGEKFEGKFENGQRNGYGIKYAVDGRIIQQGQWKKEVFQA